MADGNDRKVMPVDDLDRRILAELERDPRMAYAALGARLGVTGMTAANRLQRMRSADVLDLRARPNLDAFGLNTRILGLLHAEMSALTVAQETLRASPYTLEVYRVTGEFDLAFDAALPSELELGQLVRDVQAIDGVRRLVVYHQMETLVDEAGWGAIWTDGTPSEDCAYELAPGLSVPRQMETQVQAAAAWVSALAAADLPRLRALSTPGIVFTISPPHPSAGTFDGIGAVERQAGRTRRAYNKLWYRLINIAPGTPPYALVLDALSPVEDHRGEVGTAFSRMAFAFQGPLLWRVLSLGAMDLPGMPGEPSR